MSKLNANSVELGSLTTTQRDALTSVSNGTMIYNSTDASIQAYGPSGWITVKSTKVGHTATGGTTNEYLDGGFKYKSHTFNSSGTFSISSLGDFGNTVDVLVVAGGGAGGPGPAVPSTVSGGGGGAGGLIYRPAHPVSASSYTIAVGGGGAGSAYGGGFSAFGDNASPPFPSTALVAIGGCIGARTSAIPAANRGGSGGGGEDGQAGSPAVQATTPNPRGIPANSVTYGFGNPGGTGHGEAPAYAGGGGGGAGAAGQNSANQQTGNGGDGKPYNMNGTSQYYAGGGAGGYRYSASNGVGTGGSGGGGDGTGNGNTGNPGTANTGGGGGGTGDTSNVGNGGSGVVIVRYRIE